MKLRETEANIEVNLTIRHDLKIRTSTSISEQLMVCSHERSGTHFTMNSIDIASIYCSNPWLNYDLIPLGGKINFFSTASTNAFIKEMSNLTIDGISTCNASILKSHFPLSHLGKEAKDLPLKIIYIWRDPVETFASLWNFMHRWGWDEGPKVETPIELVSSRPSGQSQRYQTSNYRDYFERWAAHVIDGIAHCEKNPKAEIISYRQLLESHTSTTENLCNNLGIQMLHKPVLPSKTENVIKGSSLGTNAEMIVRLRDLCHNRLREYPVLEALLAEDQKSTKE